MTSFQSSDARLSKAPNVKSIVMMNAALQFSTNGPASDEYLGVDEVSVRSSEGAPGQGWQYSLKRYWWIIVIAVAFAIGSTFYFAKQQPPAFAAKATLVIVPINGLATTREIVDSLNTLDRRSIVATYALLPSSRTIRERARSQLRLSEAQIRPYTVRTAVVPDTNALDVTAEGPNARFAAALAHAVAEQSVFFTREFYGIYDMKVLDWPSVPKQALGPGLLRELAVGGILGLLVGIGAALFLGFIRAEKRSVSTAHWTRPTSERLERVRMEAAAAEVPDEERLESLAADPSD